MRVFERERPDSWTRWSRPKLERWFHSPKLGEAVHAELESERYDVVHIDELLHSRILPIVSKATPPSGHRPAVVQHHHKLDTNFAKSINTRTSIISINITVNSSTKTCGVRVVRSNR